jgi:hypothetical protein
VEGIKSSFSLFGELKSKRMRVDAEAGEVHSCELWRVVLDGV